MDNESKSATIQVPVTIPETGSVQGSGKPPVIACEPAYLASALEIGPVLRLIDGMSSGLTAVPGGVFCVLMPMRCDEVAIPGITDSQSPQSAHPPEKTEAKAAAA